MHRTMSGYQGRHTEGRNGWRCPPALGYHSPGRFRTSSRSNKNGGAYLRVFSDGPVNQIDVVCEDSEEVVSVEAARPAAVLQEPVRKSEWSGRDSWVSRNPNNRPLACSRGNILSLGYGGVSKDSGF